ncbi:hypothetical protein G6L37_03150 [Agrobacterium rubi]|nr:hypothetical protein [Agrobacterium rubi]NTF24372.1 hypothetical protein [Agrobacterium rubi]
MALFEDETWEVVPQIEENVFRGETVSHVGYLVRSTRADGSQVDIVDGLGIGRTEADRDAAILFAASKDLFNAAEILAPLLPLIRERFVVSARQEDAITLLEDVVDRVSVSTSSATPGPAK